MLKCLWTVDSNLYKNVYMLLVFIFNELTSIPDEEWATVEEAAYKFWDEIAAESPTKAKVVEIIKKYNADMQKAGRPYRYG